MKQDKKTLIAIVTVCVLVIVGCSLMKENVPNTNNTVTHLDNLTAAQQKVVEYVSSGDGHGYAVEQIYKQYPDDSTISNLYFYYIAKDQYSLYQRFGTERYLQQAKDYASNIDPAYAGSLSAVIQAFANEVMGTPHRTEVYQEAEKKTNTYQSLTNRQKKEICEYVQSRYDYYDRINGGYAGDKYSKTIWKETCEKYGITESQLDIIWMNMYSY